MHVDSENKLEGIGNTAMECPHCRTHNEMIPAAIPDFAALQTGQPTLAGMVFQCSACDSPVFVRYRIKQKDDRQIEFFPVPQEVEKPAEEIQNLGSGNVAWSGRSASNEGEQASFVRGLLNGASRDGWDRTDSYRFS